ncbi:MAG: hypothetical protein WBA34_12115 [Candidatus Deferrimicrobiaceae bacterium]
MAAGQVPAERDREAWGELVGRYVWDEFQTLTFRNPKHPETAMKAFRWFCFHRLHVEAAARGLCRSEEHVVRDAYGRERFRATRYGGTFANGYREGRKAYLPVWIVGVERHQSGLIHLHGLWRSPQRLQDMSRHRASELWGKHYGRNTIEVPESQADVVSYVSKYVTKGGEIEFSASFGAARMVPSKGRVAVA